MTPEQAAWGREHVWTAGMRKTDADYPGVYTVCACQYGPCGHCAAGDHQHCRTPDWTIAYGYLTDRRGHVLAQVWLTDRACRWDCPCPHRSPEHRPAARTGVPEHDDGALFDLAVNA